MLHAFEAVEGRVRLKRDAAYLRIQLLQASRRTDEGAAGAEPGHKVRQPPLGLLENLRTRRLVVGAPVCRVIVLVRVEVEIAVLGGHGAHAPDGSVRTLHRVRVNNPCAVGPQNPLALFAHVRGHTKLEAISPSRADHRVSNACVAGSGIDQNLIFGHQPGVLGFADDVQGRAVLH